MDFLENLKSKVSSTSRGLVKKSNEIVETTKLKAAVSSEMTKIDEIMRHMGEALYVAYKSGEEADFSLEEEFAKLDESYEKVEELQERIRELKGTKTCPNCKKEMERDAVFCSVCGERF